MASLLDKDENEVNVKIYKLIFCIKKRLHNQYSFEGLFQSG